MLFFRKKYIKNCQIRHTYGEDEDEEVGYYEDDALMITERAIANGSATRSPVLAPVPAPEGANVEVGGKSCNWCGSKTHLRKSHKDCPYNKRAYFLSTERVCVHYIVLMPSESMKAV